ncbi:VOC family protein [Allokutzneria sp. NRRL B-24872]|uniref:VOC family protein n=1 Tax=Allokutzneria sp. NRRL B-24872 TaxID=1137961 RepID=UPI000A3B0385|nr:VOC family protein [Allokutzneria sp. NRRL B-24872]
MIYRLDHVGVVVEDLEAAVAFFVALGLEVDGRTTVEGKWADQLVGLDGVRADMVFVRTPDGHGLIELSTFRSPTTTATAPRAPVNVPGIPRITFAVKSVDEILDRLRGHGAELVSEVARFGDGYQYCYVRGPEGIIVGLAEQPN